MVLMMTATDSLIMYANVPPDCLNLAILVIQKHRMLERVTQEYVDVRAIEHGVHALERSCLRLNFAME